MNLEAFISELAAVWPYTNVSVEQQADGGWMLYVEVGDRPEFYAAVHEMTGAMFAEAFTTMQAAMRAFEPRPLVATKAPWSGPPDRPRMERA